MAEEFTILNPTTEGGHEFDPPQEAALLALANVIGDITFVANALRNGTSAFDVDGNVSEVKLLRKTSAEWDADNSFIPAGVPAIDLDLSDIRVGNGEDRFVDLPSLLLATGIALTAEQITAARDAALAAKADAEAAKLAAQTAATTATDRATAAAASASLSADWAAGPLGTPLPGDKLSSEQSALQANATALASIYIPIRATDLTADETFAVGNIGKRTRCKNAADVTITIPPNVFTSVRSEEAFALFRKEGAGDVTFAAATATDYVAPQIKGSGFAPLRRVMTPVTGDITATARINLPAITNGKLLCVLTIMPDLGSGLTKLDIAANLVAAPATALTFTQLRALTNPGDSKDPNTRIMEVSLTSFAGGDHDFTITGAGSALFLSMDWFAIEGHGGAAYTPVVIEKTAGASTVSGTLTGIAAQSLVIACAKMRGAVSGASAVAFNSFSSNITSIRNGTTLGAADTGVQDTSIYKNLAYGVGSGVAAAAADFVAQATFNAATAGPVLALVAYPPKSVPGAGLIDLRLEGGRNKLNVANGEAELHFSADGRTVFLKTPKP